MAQQLIALGVQNPDINPVGNFMASQKAATDQKSAQITQQGAVDDQKRAAYQALAEHALGLMGGKLDGQVDMQHFDQFKQMLKDQGNPLADHLTPELVPVIAKGSLSVLQAGQDQQKVDLAEQQLQLELDKFNHPAATPTNDQDNLAQINTERQAAGTPPMTMEEFLASKNGGNGLTITGPDGTVIQQGGKANNAYDVADAQALVKLSTQIAADGRNGQMQKGTLGKMKELLSSDQVYTGPLATQVQQLQRVAKTFGIDSGVQDTESFNALTKAAVLDKMGGSLGTGVSNADRDYIDGQVPNLENSKEGNLQLIDIMSKVADRQVQIAKFAADYKKAHSGRLDSAFNDDLATWAEANPMFEAPKNTGGSPDERGGAPASETTKPPAVGTVEGGYRFKGGDPGDQRNWEAVN